MRHTLHLAAALLTATAALTHAQVQSEIPAQIHVPESAIHHRHRAEDLSWLWQYTEPAPADQKSAYRENDLVNDPRFKQLLKQNLTAPQSFWNANPTQNKPLADVALDFLAIPGDVLGENARYITVDGCVQHFCPDRGLVWVDTGLPKPLVVFAAIDWITENRATDNPSAAYTLWLFPSRAIDSTEIPGALIHSLRRWTAQPSSGSTELQNITRVFLVDPDGTPHTLAPSAVGAHNALPSETSNAPIDPISSTQETAPKANP